MFIRGDVFTICCQQPVNITHDYTNCCLYTADPPDDEQQVCSKHIEAYYLNKLIENSTSCWFILYGYMIYLTAIGEPPGGSISVHIYTQALQSTSKRTVQKTHRTTQEIH